MGDVALPKPDLSETVHANGRIPLLDLALQNATVKREVMRDIDALIDSGAFTNGSQVAMFEDAFAKYCGADTCVGVASGLDALRLGLLAAGIRPTDEVLVPAHTFIATFEAVSQVGAIPVPVDISALDYTLDVQAAHAALTARTRFILPVHLYGQMADMVEVASLAQSHGLTVIEDACQAHGAVRDGIRSGTSGALAAFSFYPGKNLGAFGDAGAAVTSDSAIASSVRSLREHGQTAKYTHAMRGYTSRLDTIQAIVLSHKLALLDRWNEQRRAAARFYSERLSGVGDLELPAVAPGSEPVWHLFVIRTQFRAAMASHLATRGISTGIHYPVPPHLTVAYQDLGYGRGAFPIAEQTCDTVLSLPIYPGVTEAVLERVVRAIEGFFIA